MNFRKTYHLLLIITGIIMLLVFTGSLSVNGMRLPVNRQVCSMKGQWTKVSFQEDGTTGYEYSATIPEGNGEVQFLSIKSFWYSMDAYVNGKEIYSYQDINAEKGIVQQWIELPSDSEGQTLCIRTYSNKPHMDLSIDQSGCIGSQNAVLVDFLLSNLSAIILGGFSLLSGLVILLCRHFFQKKVGLENLKSFKYLGLFMVDSGAWILTDSRILQLFTGRTATIALSSFMLFMLMPFFFLRFFDEMMLHKKQNLNIMSALFLVNAIISLILHQAGIVSIFRSLIAIHLLLLISCIMMFKYSHNEIKKYNNKGMYRIQRSMQIMILCAGLSLAVFYINPAFPYAYLYGGGMMIFQIYLMITAFKELYVHLERSASLTVYHELAYTDTMTGMANRTAFVEEQEKCKYEKNLAYIMFDLNGLKMVNDVYGHRAGDQLIRQAAACILEVFSNDGKCFRIGGDEFLVILKTASEEAIKTKLDLLEQKISEVNATRTTPMEIAYGYSLKKDDSEPTEYLFSQADQNMYTKKKQMKKSK